MRVPDGGGTDPGREAMAAPEPPDAEPAVHALGVGPGDPASLTDRVREHLRAADVVVGFETVLDVIRDTTEAEMLVCRYDDQAETLSAFGDRVAAGEAGVAAFMGDPSVSGYQFLGRVERVVDGPVRVVPGISSIQVAAARARTPLEHATVVSLHRRGPLTDALDRLVAAGDDHLLCLPRPYDWMPGDVAAHLVDAGAAPDRSALVYEHLSMPAEAVTRTTLGELAATAGGDGPESTPFSDLSVLVVRAPDPESVSPGGPEGSA